MKTQSGIRALATAFLAGGLLFGTAWAQETEPNNTMDGAQELVFDGTGVVIVNGDIVRGEADIYKFWAEAGDAITVDIDNGFTNDFAPDATDLQVSLHRPDYTWLDFNNDVGFEDPGSEGSWGFDPYIDSKTVEVTGYHYIAVTVWPDVVPDDGNYLTVAGESTNGGGTYTLIVSGATPKPAGDTSGGGDTGGGDTSGGGDTTDGGDTTTETPPSGEVQHVAIRVRPHARVLERLNPKARNVIPVAILSTPGFDVSTIEPGSLTFGKTGDEDTLRNCSKYLTRVNRDRRPDLVCFFNNADAGFEPGDDRGVLKGMTKSNTPIEGSGWLKVVPEKRKFGHGHGKGHQKHDGHDRRHKGHSHTSWNR